MTGFLDRLFDLSGKVALVTGARSGLGQAMAVALASAGADIAGLGSSPMPETARLVERIGRCFAEIRCDLAMLDDADEVICGATQVAGPIDILVNCAGIIRRTPVTDMALGDWDEVLDVNLRSLFMLSQSAARHMIAYQRAGRIINVASLLAFQGGMRVAAYAAAKHGVTGLTRAMANELAPKGITVNAIAPGYMATANTEALREDVQRAAEILARIPIGRWGAPDDLATAVLFLAAPASAYVTGTTVTVDGGWLAR
jgi:2-deoxy-D-gluconate 3-dehydrogenase